MKTSKLRSLLKILLHTLFFQVMIVSFYHYDYLGAPLNLLWAFFYLNRAGKFLLELKHSVSS
ncbi:hypothetical protein GCM10011405_08720 [Rufibacter glacialis]|nr:hypothetical protein GCM10011405_08720 [Rufibacter glacialis]